LIVGLLIILVPDWVKSGWRQWRMSEARDQSRRWLEAPDGSVRHPAIGEISEIPSSYHWAFSPERAWRAMEEPAANEWLAVRPEAGQGVSEYAEKVEGLWKEGKEVLYLLPLGSWKSDVAPKVEDVVAFAAIYLNRPVVALPALHDLDSIGRRTLAGSGREQWDASTVTSISMCW
jgi:hypothetical protein